MEDFVDVFVGGIFTGVILVGFILLLFDTLFGEVESEE